METTSTASTFWKRPEGTTAKIILGVLGIAAAAALYVALPFLITLAENTLYLGFLVGIIAAIFFLVTAERPRTLLFYALSSISRAITSLFVEIDPVGILMSFIKDMQEKKETVETAITAMMGVRQKATQARRKAQEEMEDFVKKASVAQQRGMDTELQSMTELAGRRQKMIKDYDTNIQFANDTIAALTRVKGVIEYHIVNSTDEANYLKTNNEMALQMLAATHAANEALGDTDKLDVRNMAADVIRDRVAKATGEVESLLESTRSVQGEMDLTKLAFQADGAAKLAELQKQLNVAETNTQQKALSAPPMQVVQGGAPASSKWAARLNRNS